ncbi:MAG: DUF3793 family protein [Lachnospiraceae bacterium]|nr:DUF3793 family protein [Lachnospiraceae bacterium]
MQNKFESCLIEQCAPTLAGIKVGSLFRYEAENGENVYEIIYLLDMKLKEKGVRVCILKEEPRSGLIYVFRPAMLSKLLSDKDINDFLYNSGFAGGDSLDMYINRLKQRFLSASPFPHEIGIFLGYPLHDVKGFIENKGENFSLCGAWKVYDKKPMAEKLFKQYKKCMNIYKALFKKGADVLELTVMS